MGNRSPMEIDPLCVSVADLDVDAVELTRRALVFARDRANDVVRVVRDELLGEAVHADTELLDALAAELVLIDLSEEVRRRVVAVMRRLVRSVPSPSDERGVAGYVAHRLALVLEEKFGSQFFEQISKAGPRFLDVDDLLVQASPFADGQSAFSKHYHERHELGPNPRNMGSDRPDRLAMRGGLVPKARNGARLRWHPTSWSTLDALRPESVVAAVVPVQGDRDLVTPPAVQTASGRRFFGVVPKDGATAKQSALDLVHRADEAGAELIVLPEVCATLEGVEAVADWVERQARHIRVAVCGSCHDDSSGQRRNVAIVTRGRSDAGARIIVEKSVPFVRNSDRAVEDIAHAQPIVDLLVSRRWSALTQICIDFFDEALAEYVLELRPSLVLVPACTETFISFETVARHLALRCQAHVVVANQRLKPRKGHRAAAQAMIARPTRDDQTVIARTSSRTGPVPGIRVATLGSTNPGRWNTI